MLSPIENGKFQGLIKAFELFFSTFRGRFIFIKRDVSELLFQRGIIIGLYYFSLKLVNNGKCITVFRGSLRYTPV